MVRAAGRALRAGNGRLLRLLIKRLSNNPRRSKELVETIVHHPELRDVLGHWASKVPDLEASAPTSPPRPTTLQVVWVRPQANDEGTHLRPPGVAKIESGGVASTSILSNAFAASTVHWISKCQRK
jgi:hypothetical protein